MWHRDYEFIILTTAFYANCNYVEDIIKNFIVIRLNIWLAILIIYVSIWSSSYNLLFLLYISLTKYLTSQLRYPSF
jgi:hypothetical protein